MRLPHLKSRTMHRIYLFLSGCIIFGNLMSNEPVKLQWELGYPDPLDTGQMKWTGATVPGAVQLDIAKAEGYGPYIHGENWRDYLWMEEREFVYRSRFTRPVLDGSDRVYFISGLIDFVFYISLNGQLLLHQEGMFTPVRLDLTDKLDDKNELQVKIHPIPKKHLETADRTQAAASVKPAVSYGWDWHPRLVPSGIWDDTYLQVLPSSHIEDVSLQYVLNEALTEAEVQVEVTGRELDGCLLTWKLYDAGDRVVDARHIVAAEDGGTIGFVLKDPELWWPHDHGFPTLYSYSVELADRYGNQLQTIQGRTGFRRVELVMNEGGWEGPEGFPKTRSVAPIQMEVNGRPVFCKGTNWVNPEIFPGMITGDRYRELVDRAVEANFNMLRVWGGGIVNKQFFHDLCDEKGILVWQEFPLACNDYKGTPEYLEVLDQESVSIIRRLRKHPSLAMWSGGNELFNAWSRMTDQSLAVRLLNSRCLELDPHTPFISTSPLYGMGHGHYVFRDPDTGEEVYSIMNSARNTAYTEFGMPSPSSVKILRSIIPDDELWPPRPGTSWESHHAFNAWVGDTWLMKGMIEDYFGRSEHLEGLVAHGQLLQCEGYKAIYEEARRQKPYCSMALNWCYNEPWPTAANNSIINWPNIPKPAFYAVRDACRPVMASARNSRMQWKEGETFTTQLWILNDLPEGLAGGRVEARLVAGESVIELGEWEYEGAEANSNLAGPELSTLLPGLDADRFILELEVEGHPEYRSTYTFLYLEQ